MRASRRAVLAGLAAGVTGCVAPRQAGRSITCPAPVGSDAADARLGFVGDLMLGRNVDDRWGDPGRDPSGVWDGLQGRLQSLDGVIGNLECCLSTRGDPRDRTFTFRADPDWAVPALRAGNLSVASLANNHVLDFGRGAFRDTLDHLDRAGVATAGAGGDLGTALAPAVTTIGSLRVAVIGLTDRYRAYEAGADAPGTAFTPLERGNPRTEVVLERALRLARAAAPDLLVASLHWGPNWVVRPSRAQQRFARYLIDRGVDVVHGHSAHVIQGIEVYRGRPIIYDAGDFVDDYAVKEGLHNDRSLLFELGVADGRFQAVRLTPVHIVREQVRPATGDVADWVRDRIRVLSRPFGTTLERDGEALHIDLGTC